MVEKFPRRRTIRLQRYDYSRVGVYFVTVCTFRRVPLFGEIDDGKMLLSGLGDVARSCWEKIPDHFPQAKLDAYVVMPNHVHGIIVIVDNPVTGTACRAPTCEHYGAPTVGTIPTIIRSFKSAVTKGINEPRSEPRSRVWQRNYYEHIIRDEASLNRICEYIVMNPLSWGADDYYC